MLFVLTVMFYAGFLGHGVKCSSSIKIDVTTQYHDRVVPNAFNIRCTPEIQANCAIAIISIQMSRGEDKLIATIQRDNSIFYDRLLKSSVKADGHIDSDFTKAFLSVTINDAVKEDSGLYSCKLLYLDDALQYQTESSSTNVTITNQDTKDIVKHLLSKISFMENLVQFQQNEMSTVKAKLESHAIETNQTDLDLKTTTTNLVEKVASLETAMTTQRNEFNSKEAELKAQISLLTNEIDVQKLGLGQLEHTHNTTVSFVAWHTRSGVFVAGRDVIYGDVIENIGNGYNGHTGVFTAPLDGFYLLHVSACLDGSSWIFLDLKSSTGRVLTRLFAYVRDNSDGSCVAKLTAGERVWPVVKRVGSKLALHGEDTRDPMSKFYGFLLKAL